MALASVLRNVWFIGLYLRSRVFGGEKVNIRIASPKNNFFFAEKKIK